MHTRAPRVRRHRASSDHAAPPASRPRALGSTTGRPRTAADEERRIAAACERLELELVAVLADPGQALDRLDAGEASCLVVSRLDALAPDVGGLAEVLDRIESSATRLVALDVALDSDTATGRLALARSEPAAEAEPEPEPEPEPDPEPEPPAEPEAAEPEPVAAVPPPPAPEPAAPAPAATHAIGYASAPGDTERVEQLDAQREQIRAACATQGIELVDVVCDREPTHGKALDRAGLTQVLGRIAAGEATCLVVCGLDRLSRSVAELGPLVRWGQRNSVRLIALDIALDTADEAGRTAARALADVGDWERQRLSERTRKGLEAARSKRHAGDATAARGGGGVDYGALRKRIAAMRTDGMTLQAIADTLNAEGVPTVRGGREWRPSSVQTAAGYRRRSRARTVVDLPAVAPRTPEPPS